MDCKHHESIDKSIGQLEKSDEKQWKILDSLRWQLALVYGGLVVVQIVITFFKG